MVKFDLKQIETLMNEKEEEVIVGGVYQMGTSFYKTYAFKICMEYQELRKKKQTNKQEETIIECNKNSYYDYRKLEIGVPYFIRKKTLRKLLTLWIDLIPLGFKYYNGIESDKVAVGP